MVRVLFSSAIPDNHIGGIMVKVLFLSAIPDNHIGGVMVRVLFSSAIPDNHIGGVMVRVLSRVRQTVVSSTDLVKLKTTKLVIAASLISTQQ